MRSCWLRAFNQAFTVRGTM